MCCDVCGSVDGSANVSGWVWSDMVSVVAVHRYLRKLESSDPLELEFQAVESHLNVSERTPQFLALQRLKHE